VPIRQRFKRSEPSQRLYGFVDGVVKADPERPRSRETLLLDCVDAKAFDVDPEAALRDESNLFLVRTTSTHRRWNEDLGLETAAEGSWVELRVRRSPGVPRAWIMPASAGYEAEGSTNTVSIAELEDDGEITDGPIPAESPIGRRLRSHCRLNQDERRLIDQRELESALQLAGGHVEVCALDVGQASCTVISIDGDPKVVFDAGAPLYRNNKSFKPRVTWPLPTSGAVIISHWDFDHFDLGRRVPALRQLNWYAPYQPVGPNTLKFQRQLGSRLKFISGPFGGPFPGGAFLLEQGLSTLVKDRNGTGYCLRLQVGNAAVLLTGDADYAMIPPNLIGGVTHMTVPHHGGPCTLPPKPASGVGRAVISYGRPNGYRHPSLRTIGALSPNWDIHFTASHPGYPPRGDRLVFP